MINLIHVLFSLDFGGLEKVVVDLAEGVDRKKYHVIICCLDKLGDLAREAESKGVEVILVRRNPGLDLGLPFRLSRVFKSKNISIVHSHNFAPMLYGTLGAKIAKVPFILNTIHGREKKIKHNCIWSMVWKLNNYIVTISDDARKEFFKYAKVDAERVKVIHNGINVAKFSCEVNKDAVKKELGISASDFVIGTVSRLSNEKDQFTLLEAFKEVVRSFNNVELVFVGDGEIKRELESYSAQLGISDKVIFLGFRNDIEGILPVFDVFVLTSLTEGISISLLEAMAASKPVVATRVGGNVEIVEQGKTGILVAPKNPKEIAGAIVRLLKDQNLSLTMGKEARKRVETYFSLKRMIANYESLYEKCQS